MDIKDDYQTRCISFWIENRIRGKSNMQSRGNVNEKLAQALHKTMIKKFKRRKVYSRFKDNIWAVDLAEMGSLSS